MLPKRHTKEPDIIILVNVSAIRKLNSLMTLLRLRYFSGFIQTSIARGLPQC